MPATETTPTPRRATAEEEGDVRLAARAASPFEPREFDLGAGPDTLVLEVSQDYFRGHARYTITIEGKQFAGVFGARALHDSGDRDTLTLRGDWGDDPLDVTVTLVNDLWQPGVGDRNIYVDRAVYNGGPASDALGDSWTGGSFAVRGPDGNDTVPGGGGDDAVRIQAGQGPDTLLLEVSQDAFEGPARYTVAVNGQQVGGVFTARADHDGAARDELTLRGDWGDGALQVTVTLVNDLWQPGIGDRNIYVDGARYNGGAETTALGNSGSGGTFTIRDDTGNGGPGPDVPGRWTNVWTESFDGEGWADVLGMFSRAWGPGIDTSVSGQLTIWTDRNDADSGAMVPPTGRDAGYGYGLYEFTIKTQGTVGIYALTWPGTDVWPGPELDILEIGYDGVPYSTIHWKGADGSNQHTSYRLEGVDPTEVHTYAMDWQRDFINIYVDGVLMHHITEHVPRSYADGGENTCPGIGTQTWWNGGALGGENYITLYEASYSVVG